MHIYGHRGARGEAPENTIAGCRYAIEHGVLRIEIDLRLSSDGFWVVIHDSSVDRTTDSSGSVDGLGAAELARMDARYSSPRWRGDEDTRIPMLVDLLAATPEITHYQLEVKPGAQAPPEQAVADLAALLVRHGPPERYTVTSLSPAVLKQVRSVEPGFSLGMVALETDSLFDAKSLGCRFFCPEKSTCGRELVNAAHTAGMHISAWTANSADEMKRLQTAGVDSIITDFPSVAAPLFIQS